MNEDYAALRMFAKVRAAIKRHEDAEISGAEVARTLQLAADDYFRERNVHAIAGVRRGYSQEDGD